MTGVGTFMPDLIDPPVLIYDVHFDNGIPMPSVNALNIAPFSTAASLVSGQNHFPASGDLRGLAGGLELRITRPAMLPDGTGVAVVCGVDLPPAVHRFRLVAHGRMGSTDSAFDPANETTDLWAPLLIVHSADFVLNPLILKPDDSFGATHQVRGGAMVALGTAGALDSTPNAAPVSKATAYPDSANRRFELVAEFDGYTGRGFCRLVTPGHNFAIRSWRHPFELSHTLGVNGPTHVGVGLAIARGVGTATVTFDLFQVYHWDHPSPLTSEAN